LISEFLVSVLQANVSNYMIYSNSVRVNADKFIVFYQPILSIILNFSGDTGVRINLNVNCIS